MALRQTPLHRSILRPQTMFGAEREPALLAVLLSGTVAFAGYLGLSPTVMLAGAGLWVFLIWGLRQLYKADPQMAQVYLRHIRYAPFSLARSTPWRRNP